MGNKEAEQLIRDLTSDTELVEDFRINQDKVLEDYDLSKQEHSAISSGNIEYFYEKTCISEKNPEVWLVGGPDT